MNTSDSAVLDKILKNNFMKQSDKPSELDIIFLNTCAIREKAEEKVHQKINRLTYEANKQNFSQKIAVIGCMAERMKQKLIDDYILVSIVGGPDSQRRMP